MVKHFQPQHRPSVAGAVALHAPEWSNGCFASTHIHLVGRGGQRGIPNPDCDHSIRPAHKSGGGNLRRLFAGCDDYGSHLYAAGDGA